MRQFLFGTTLALALSAPALGEAPCIEVLKIGNMQKHSTLPVSSDLRQAVDACTAWQAALLSRDMAQTQQAADVSDATLLRLNFSLAEIFNRMDQVAATIEGVTRFDALPDLAKLAFDAGQYEKAQLYAREMLRLASEYRNDYGYGNAIYYGNFVLGRLALREGNVALASQYLLNSVTTPGSPQLDSFGPNVTLAKELLEKGQSDLVLQFLAQTRTFWKNDHGKVAEWSAAIHNGRKPDFRANLGY